MAETCLLLERCPCLFGMSDSGLTGLLDLDLLPRIFLNQALFDMPAGVFIRDTIKQTVELIRLRGVLSSLNLWGLRLCLLKFGGLRLCWLLAAKFIHTSGELRIHLGLSQLRLCPTRLRKHVGRMLRADRAIAGCVFGPIPWITPGALGDLVALGWRLVAKLLSRLFKTLAP